LSSCAFASTLNYQHKEFLNLHPHQVQPTPAPQQVQPAPVPHTKQCGFCTCPTNAGTNNLRGLTHPTQDSTRMWRLCQVQTSQRLC